MLSESFRCWTCYDGNETSDDESSADDVWDENSAAGNVQGIQWTFTAWHERVTVATAFAGWWWCVHIQNLGDSDTEGGSGGGQDSDLDCDGGSGDDDFPEPIYEIEQQSMLSFGTINPVGVLWKCQLNDFSDPRGGYEKVQQRQLLNMRDIETQVRWFEACEL